MERQPIVGTWAERLREKVARAQDIEHPNGWLDYWGDDEIEVAKGAAAALEVAELALRKYGEHKPYCGCSDANYEGSCTCGFTAALLTTLAFSNSGDQAA